MRVGQSRKRDGNEKAIVEMLEAYGALVQRLSGEGVADLLVCYQRKLFALEVKAPRGHTTLAQDAMIAAGWPVVVVRNADEALRAIGAV